MSGQNKVDPFKVERDVVRDTVTVTTNLTVNTQQATAGFTGGNANVTMPFTGCITIGVTGASDADTLTIVNPFINTTSTVVTLGSVPTGATATVGASGNAGCAHR